MQKWEYLYVEVMNGIIGLVNGQGTTKEMEKGREPWPEWHNEEVHEFLNRVGRDGWEVVSHSVLRTADTYSSHMGLIFKRPIPDDTD